MSYIYKSSQSVRKFLQRILQFKIASFFKFLIYLRKKYKSYKNNWGIEKNQTLPNWFYECSIVLISNPENSIIRTTKSKTIS